MGSPEPVAFQWWEPGTVAPTVLLADRVDQRGLTFDGLILHRVLIRRPLEGGAAWLRAPAAQFSRSAQQALQLTGPVMVSGVLNGSPLVGTAGEATSQLKPRGLTLYPVSILHRGMASAAPTAVVGEDGAITTDADTISQDARLKPRAGTIWRPAPAVVGVLAALPRPIPMPDMLVRRQSAKSP